MRLKDFRKHSRKSLTMVELIQIIYQNHLMQRIDHKQDFTLQAAFRSQ